MGALEFQRCAGMELPDLVMGASSIKYRCFFSLPILLLVFLLLCVLSALDIEPEHKGSASLLFRYPPLRIVSEHRQRLIFAALDQSQVVLSASSHRTSLHPSGF
jgi:hypothetical protein